MGRFTDRKAKKTEETFKYAGSTIMRGRYGWVVRRGGRTIGETETMAEAEALAMHEAERAAVRIETDDIERIAERRAEAAAEYFHATGRRCSGFDEYGMPI